MSTVLHLPSYPNMEKNARVGKRLNKEETTEERERRRKRPKKMDAGTTTVASGLVGAVDHSLRNAIDADDVAAVETLWSGKMRTLESKTEDSPLIHACRIGSMGSVRWLVFGAGVGVYRVNKNGYTALCIAAQKGHMEVVQFLVCEAKVDVNRQAG
jgi:hypothetical protein